MATGGKRPGAGRKQKPVELKVLEGTFRKDRNGDAPGGVGGFPQLPEGLTPSQQALWQAFPRVAWIGESDRMAVHGAVALYDLILKNHQAMQATEQAGNPLAFKYSHDADGNQNVEPKENPLYTQQL